MMLKRGNMIWHSESPKSEKKVTTLPDHHFGRGLSDGAASIHVAIFVW